MEEKNMGTKRRKKRKQDLTSGKDLTTTLLEGHNSIS